MNSVTLIGVLTKDPELRQAAKTKVCDLRLAERNARPDRPLFISVAVFGRQAELCDEYLSKGRQVAVAGQLRFREWDGADGARHSEHSIAADSVDFLAAPRPREEAEAAPSDT